MHVFNTTNVTCDYDYGESFLLNRFIIVAVMMTSVCIIGFFGNLLIIIILSQKRMRSPSNWYLIVLAFFDTSVMAASVLLYVVETIYDYTRNYELYAAWAKYVKILYGFSHFFQVATVYLTLAATIERFISQWSEQYSRRFCVGVMPFVWIFVVLAFSVACTTSRFFELRIHENKNCTGVFGQFGLREAPLLTNEIYNAVYTVWLGNILFVFLPFFLLAGLNFFIYWKMRHQHHIELMQMNQTMNGTAMGSTKARSSRKNREATVVLVVVVFVFLVCNFPGFALTLIEQIGGHFLAKYREFYATTRDVINLLAVINSAANFTIYLILGREFRWEIRLLAITVSRKLHCRRILTKLSISRSFEYSNSSDEYHDGPIDGDDNDCSVSDASGPWRMRPDVHDNDPRTFPTTPSLDTIWERQPCVYWSGYNNHYPVSAI